MGAQYWICIGLAVIAAILLAVGVTDAARAALFAHAVLFLGGAGGLLTALRGRIRVAAAVAAGLILAAGALVWLPRQSPASREWLDHAHTALAAVTIVLLLVVAGPRRRAAAIALSAVCLLLLGGYAVARYSGSRWYAPAYDSEATYRFLTATTSVQAGTPLFPSALMARTGADNCGGCHAAAHAEWSLDGHAAAASSRAYRATYSDFVRRKRPDAARWCRGCHDPASFSTNRPGAGVTCTACHDARTVHALYGSAALVVRGGTTRPPGLFPVSHGAAYLRPEFHRSAEFCAACHRKNFNLPQNQYHWLPGPDEYREWRSSRFSGAVLARGEATRAVSCTGCHNPHGSLARTDAQRLLALDVVLRRPGRGVVGDPFDLARPPAPGETVRLDVVVQNLGIGHAFPTGMPNLQESWLEVAVADHRGRPIAASGRLRPDGAVDPEAHRYQLVPLDRRGQPIRNGALDEMVAAAEWRTIAAGTADVARYRLTVPGAGLGAVSVRVLRRREPGFSRWAGEGAHAPPEVVAQARFTLGAGTTEGAARRWRRYGSALGHVTAYPQAIAALQRALRLDPGDAEANLALGQVFLKEGDRLAAMEQFRQAERAPKLADAARAWQGSLLRQMGQPDAAIALLEPLARRYPRDLDLRFELGRTYMDELRNEDAARQFEAMAGLDPTDVRAHFNLMLCWQRLNRLPEARREEALYRLLAPPEDPAVQPARPAIEDRLLHEHALAPEMPR